MFSYVYMYIYIHTVYYIYIILCKHIYVFILILKLSYCRIRIPMKKIYVYPRLLWTPAIRRITQICTLSSSELLPGRAVCRLESPGMMVIYVNSMVFHMINSN